MKVVSKNIDELKPSSYNPRKQLKSNSPEYKKIKDSIKKFGYVDPIIVNQDNTVIGGHQRLKVLKDLGYKDVDVIQLELSKEDEKALNIALNKISGQWDEPKLNDLLNELKDVDFDISLTGFEDLDINIHDEDKADDTKENERIKTIEGYNLDIYDYLETDGFYEMPIIHKENIIPDDLIGFNYMLTSKDTNCGVHMFVDDYQFERVWNNPKKYIERMKEFQCVFSPDFSLYLDMPMAMKIWNIYRSRMIGQYMQRNGVHVIPTISWAEEETFEFAFDGIEQGSIVAISTIGVKQNDYSFSIWVQGVYEMIKIIKPEKIICYGGKVDYDFKEIEVIYYENKVTERMEVCY